MFFPIRDENPRLTAPVIVKAIVAVNVIVWLFVEGAGSSGAVASAIDRYGAVPADLTSASPHWYTIFTSLFLHASWFHIIGNLWFLWVFGDNVEDAFGHIGFLVFYIACGLVAAGAQIAVDPSGTIPMVGASGAISGVLGAYIVKFPHVRVQTFVLIIVFFTVVRIPAFIILGYWFVIQILAGLPQLGGGDAGVAFWAHVGGFVAGALIALVTGTKRQVTAGSHA